MYLFYLMLDCIENSVSKNRTVYNKGMNKVE